MYSFTYFLFLLSLTCCVLHTLLFLLGCVKMCLFLFLNYLTRRSLLKSLLDRVIFVYWVDLEIIVQKGRNDT